MSESGNRKLTILTVLVAVLLVAIVAQSVLMFGLHKQLRGPETPEEPDRVALVPDDDSDAGDSDSTLTLPADPLDDDPFDWNLEDWDPFKEMQSMHDRINRMFGNAFSRFEHSSDFGDLFEPHTFSPAVDVENLEDRYMVSVNLPGADESRIDVKLEGQTLTISGSVESEASEEDSGKMLRQERRSGKFQRTITLPSPVQADKMTTKNEKGVLYIEIPKATADE